MEVPCCRKLDIFLDTILDNLDREIEVKEVIISKEGQIKK
jgi:hypothetical protein